MAAAAAAAAAADGLAGDPGTTSVGVLGVVDGGLPPTECPVGDLLRIRPPLREVVVRFDPAECTDTDALDRPAE